MKREGWERFLNDYLAASQTLPFEWGVSDCCLWVARYADGVSGSNHALEWQGQYDTEEGARSVMTARGFSCPAEIADAYRPRKDIKYIGRGDIVEHPTGALGICAGRKSYFMKAGAGLVGFDTLKCTAAWGV